MFRADGLKIYPTLVIRGTGELYHIRQNLQVGKLLRLECKMGVRGKIFVVVCL